MDSKARRIIRRKSELEQGKKELDRWTIEYIRIAKARRISWRDMAAELDIDHAQLHKFAAKHGL